MYRGMSMMTLPNPEAFLPAFLVHAMAKSQGICPERPLFRPGLLLPAGNKDLLIRVDGTLIMVKCLRKRN